MSALLNAIANSMGSSISSTFKPKRIHDAWLDDLRMQRQQDQLRIEAARIVQRCLDAAFHLGGKVCRVGARKAFGTDHAIADDFCGSPVGLRRGFVADG